MNHIRLKLFVIGNSSISKRAIINLETICSHPKLIGLCDIEVVDVRKHKDLISEEKILATPLLIRKKPLPERRVLGDLSNIQKVLDILEIS
ncbi:KaiB-like protein 2 [Legionella norrlandica]|uniref:KaiB-like protein 2 n=1 Tax=Legionella norrlandica TaxID=1498499 RepID=A0A0A2SU07_9GAMM|nr:circadian clock KaiB family protein [Legionella norrlandica]KGP63211.1 KaiB-like protein 2 [Legionella norrlandica]